MKQMALSGERVGSRCFDAGAEVERVCVEGLVRLGFEGRSWDKIMASHKETGLIAWIDRYWYWLVIAFGVACMLALDFWHPILGG